MVNLTLFLVVNDFVQGHFDVHDHLLMCCLVNTVITFLVLFFVDNFTVLSYQGQIQHNEATTCFCSLN